MTILTMMIATLTVKGINNKGLNKHSGTKKNDIHKRIESQREPYFKKNKYAFFTCYTQFFIIIIGYPQFLAS